MILKYINLKRAHTNAIRVLSRKIILLDMNVKARSRSGLSLQTSGDRKRPRMQPTIPQMVFQLLI